jgi:hypothetical protein
VADDDPLVIGRIALAHLNEFPDYYTRLGQWRSKQRATCATRARARPCASRAPLASVPLSLRDDS